MGVGRTWPAKKLLSLAGVIAIFATACGGSTPTKVLTVVVRHRGNQAVAVDTVLRIAGINIADCRLFVQQMLYGGQNLAIQMRVPAARVAVAESLLRNQPGVFSMSVHPARDFLTAPSYFLIRAPNSRCVEPDR